jgi:hypothetical protein
MYSTHEGMILSQAILTFPAAGVTSVNLIEMIRSLYGEKEIVERAIASLEELQQISGPGQHSSSSEHRGRKSMSTDERRQVSARMKKYWAARRKPKL